VLITGLSREEVLRLTGNKLTSQWLYCVDYRSAQRRSS
jgi:hypothetical protein